VLAVSVSSLFVSCKKDSVNQAPVANAGTNKTIDLPTDTVTLVGFGTDADGAVVGYLWNKLSGPSSVTIASPNTVSTLISNLSEGTYVFQLTVTDNQGATGNDTVSITVNPTVIDTITLSPDHSSDEIHLLGNNSGYEASDPTAPEIGGAAWTVFGTPVAMRAALKFDLSSIPSDAIINSAKLTLYSNPTPLNGNQIDANYGSDNSLLIQKIITTWSSGTANWSNQPATTTNGQIIIPSTTQKFLDLNDIDVTNLVSSMVNNNANYGFLLRLQTENMYTSRIFCSSKYPDSNKHPKLVVAYTKTHH